MRNGNSPNLTLEIKGRKKVLILPMRNGNKHCDSYRLYQKHSSYPTYEEWKLFLYHQDLSVLLRSYPTYEEWKLH